MRKILMALVLAFAVAGPAAAATTTATPAAEQQQQIVLKKKQAAASAKAAADAKKAADARQAAQAKKLADARAAQNQPSWACEGFWQQHSSARRTPTRGSTPSKFASMDETTGQDIDWAPASKYAMGTIVVSTPERALYFVTGPGQARRYSVGVGREGFQWSGNSTIVSKAEWPTWRPPQEMITREAAKGHILPTDMAGGPENPLGARAMYIGGKLYRIHGTNSPGSIGTAASSGCIRMMNADVIELYDKVKIGARVYVYQ